MKQSSFGRKRDSRELLLRSLATSVILYESVITTEAKGRAIQPVIDRLVRIAQSEDKVTARRRLLGYLLDENATKKLLEELTSRFDGQTSGFTRRFRLPNRSGDGAPQVVIQLTKTVLLDEPKKASKEKAAATVTTPEASEGESHE